MMVIHPSGNDKFEFSLLKHDSSMSSFFGNILAAFANIHACFEVHLAGQVAVIKL